MRRVNLPNDERSRGDPRFEALDARCDAAFEFALSELLFGETGNRCNAEVQHGSPDFRKLVPLHRRGTAGGIEERFNIGENGISISLKPRYAAPTRLISFSVRDALEQRWQPSLG